MSAELVREQMKANEIVRFVLSRHQQAYAKAHAEGNSAIASENLAILSTTVQLEERLASDSQKLRERLTKLPRYKIDRNFHENAVVHESATGEFVSFSELRAALEAK